MVKKQSFPTFGIQMGRAPMAESPSMSSLTENTTWDSRLLDCSIARSVSPFKFPRGNCTPTSIKACRMDNSVLFKSQGTEKISGDFGSDEESISAIAAAKAATKAHKEYRRTSSSGTNILYRIRREELSKGKCPSVRQMAKAFDSFEQTRQNEKEAIAEERRKGEKIAQKTLLKTSKGTTPTRLFGILSKASSMDQSLSSAGRKLPPTKAKAKRRPSDHQASSPLKNDGLLIRNNNGDIRGGRNPFKGMGSRLVERVRRSLSRTGKKRSQSREEGTPLSISVTLGNNEALISSTTTAAIIK
ncbi:hypothetical protein Mgra_00008016 [Meloidogyne graminicola]|uniref:Uncharacterized protein n=1 Tax=Meloidogyne graminicola TaxID=189291 RepID=A0A8S9ZH60_9BILA|nr:hypothetical protein Mgra_00008016 [Meloidogyne graminicola]